MSLNNNPAALVHAAKQNLQNAKISGAALTEKETLDLLQLVLSMRINTENPSATPPLQQSLFNNPSKPKGINPFLTIPGIVTG